MADSFDPSARIADYLSGECSQEEALQVEAWIAGDAEAGAFVESQREFRQQLQAQAIAEESALASRAADIARRVRADIDRKDSYASSRPQRHVATKRPFGRAFIAAGALGIAALAVFLGGNRPSGATTTQEYTTGPGQHATLRLADGTQATLGPSTKLRVDVSSGQGGTEATVVGQALFTVTHRLKTPFVVRTGNAVAQVLGTTFSARHYSTDSESRIVVFDGKVATGDSQSAQRAVLTARTAAFVGKSGAIRVVSDYRVEDDTAWTKSLLAFNQATSEEIADELGRAFGVRIQIADSAMAKRRRTWNVDVSRQSLTDVLDALSVTLNARVSHRDDVYVLSPAQRR